MTSERWLVTGASGQLGGHVVRQLAAGHAHTTLLALAGQHGVTTPGVGVCRFNLTDSDALRATIATFRPTHVIHTAAMSAVGLCYHRPTDAERVNTEATRVLAAATQDCGARLVFTSTDMVFAGDAAPYCESDPPQPLSRYAQTKLAAEQFLTGCRHVATVRLPLMYGFPCGSRATTFVKQIAALRAGEPLSLFADEFRTPVWLVDAARVLIGLARSDFTGLIHVAGPDRLSRYELIANCAALLNIAAPRLVPISRHDGDAPEPRPEDLSLDASHFQALFPNLCPGPLRESVFTTA